MMWGRPWALLFARLVLGFIFFMAGQWKTFILGPVEHARRLFIVPYAGTYLPEWALWATGTTVPVVELVAGFLVLVGWQRRAGYLALGGVLVLVTYGHLVIAPLYPFHEHVIPRLALLLFLLMSPLAEDRWSVDEWLARRRAAT
jgi:putative oxidoreductase